MIWRVRDRATFDGLRRHARRVHRGPVSVAFLAGGDPPVARVAYSVGRKSGGAVVRNRIRRRIRSAVAEIGLIAPGSYMIVGRPDAATMSFGELKAVLAKAVGAATADSGTLRQ